MRSYCHLNVFFGCSHCNSRAFFLSRKSCRIKRKIMYFSDVAYNKINFIANKTPVKHRDVFRLVLFSCFSPAIALFSPFALFCPIAFPHFPHELSSDLHADLHPLLHPPPIHLLIQNSQVISEVDEETGRFARI